MKETIKLCIDTTMFEYKPTSNDTAKIKTRLNNPSSIKDVTLTELFNCIAIGNTFCPAVLKGGTRNENWVQQELVAIDIDNEDTGEILTIDKAITLLKEHNINPIGYYHTFNYTVSKPKFRLLFLLNEPIYEADKMKFIIETLIDFIPQTDKSCKDLSRLFYGTNKETIILDPSTKITYEDIRKIASSKITVKNKTDYKISNELQNLINDFDLLDFMIKDGNIVSSNSDNITYFKNCKICGHKDCLRYYHDTNSFYCFGANGNKGGNVINYLMITKKLTYNKALDYFKYNVLKQPLLQNNNSFINTIQKQINDIGLNITINDVNWVQQCKTNKGISYEVLCSNLEKYFKEKIPHIFARSGTKSGISKYVYINNYYKEVSDSELKGIIKAFIPSENVKMAYINEVFNLLEANVNLIQLDNINTNKFVINFNNGLLDIKTGILKQHSQKYLCTVRIPCNYTENVSTPTTHYFDNFINDLTNGNEQVKKLILEIMGVVISNVPGYKMKQAVFMFGAGNTGKTVLKNFLTELIGPENCSSIDIYELENKFSKIQMFNKRLVGSNDMSFMSVKELKTFKQATGGDRIYAEYKGENGIDFIFNGVLWFCGNTLPKFSGDRGDWVYDRIITIECNNVIPEENQDKELVKHLLEEKEYIVSLAIKALKKVIQNGYKYDIPECCRQLNDNYKIDNHSFLKFYKECVIDRPNDKIEDNCTIKIFYDIYREWCKDNNNGYAESKQEVHKLLVAMGKGTKIKTNGGYCFYKEITLSRETKTTYEKIYGTVEEYCENIPNYEDIINTNFNFDTSCLENLDDFNF